MKGRRARRRAPRVERLIPIAREKPDPVQIIRSWGLCGGCIVRAGGELAGLEPKHVYRRCVRFFGEPLAITEAQCAECWRLIFELRRVKFFNLHRLEAQLAGVSA